MKTFRSSDGLHVPRESILLGLESNSAGSTTISQQDAPLVSCPNGGSKGRAAIVLTSQRANREDGAWIDRLRHVLGWSPEGLISSQVSHLINNSDVVVTIVPEGLQQVVCSPLHGSHCMISLPSLSIPLQTAVLSGRPITSKIQAIA